MKRDNITEDTFHLRESASIDVSAFSFDYVLQKIDKNEVKRIVKLLWQEFYIPEVLTL